MKNITSERAHKTETAGFDVKKIRKDFPILGHKMHGKPLVYLDNAATSQKPRVVLDTLQDYYTRMNSNIHRGVYEMSEQATKAYELTRVKVQRFLNAPDPNEIIFVRGTTEGINLVAQAFVRRRLHEGDEVLISAMEHHSNIVPWQMVCDETGARLKVVPIDDRGEFLMEEYEKLLTSKTRFVSVSQISNALGTINPVKEIIRLAHARGVPILIDGAQAVPHTAVDVRDLDCDFYVFSGHKMYGPTGVGIVYGRLKLLEEMPPYQGGGDMISSVTFEKTIYNKPPYKFEAGTPHIAGGVALGAAIDYVSGIGLDKIEAYESELLAYATEAVAAVPGIKIIGTAREKAGVISFVVDGIHAHDVGTILDQEGIAIRTGHHCAQPVMKRFGIDATARASLGMYNTREEIDALTAALSRVREVFH